MPAHLEKPAEINITYFVHPRPYLPTHPQADRLSSVIHLPVRCTAR